MLSLSVAVLTLTAPPATRRAAAVAVPIPLTSPAPVWRVPNAPSEYDLNVGKLVDSLRHDYPMMLESEPDLSLFMNNVEFEGGPFGSSVQGLDRYKRALGSLRWANKVANVDAEIGTRIVLSGGAVRVRWTACMRMRQSPAMAKLGLGGISEPSAVVDGISVYELDSRGHVRKHRLENVATHGGQLSPALSSHLASLTGLIGGRSAPECIPC